MKIEPLYLKKANVINLQKRDLEIGRGNDGIVYKTGISNSDELYKLYFRKSKIGSEPCYLELVDEKDAVDNIYKAIDRQSYVKRTKLQKRPIYINNRFRGVVIHYHKKQIPIYFLKSCPLKIQIVVLKELLVSIEELLDNFIYPRDLALQPYTDYRTSNVLLSFSRKLTPNIIDIDGRSAIYTDDYNEDFYYTALNSYKNLVMQILFDIDIMKLNVIDLEYFSDLLNKKGINSKYLEYMLSIERRTDIDEFDYFFEDISKLDIKAKKKKRNK